MHTELAKHGHQGKQMMEDPSEEGGTLARVTSFASGKELEKDALGKYQPTILLILKVIFET